MKKASTPLLKLTLQLMDIFNLRTCYELWKICNGNQFEQMPGTEFASFLNLKTCNAPVVVKSRENLRICFLIYILSSQIQNSEMANEWKESMLASCNISASYYKSHYKDAEDLGASKDCKSFVKAVKNVVFTCFD